MKTIFVLSPHPETAEAIRAGLNPEQYRVIHRTGQAEVDPMIARGLAQAVIVDTEFTGLQGVWFVERLRRHNPHCPVIFYVSNRHAEWEEEAYLRGVSHVLSKPVKPRALAALLERLCASEPRPAPRIPTRVEYPVGVPALPSAGSTIIAQPLTVLRNFSSILTHSLNADAMLRQFLLQLRDIIGLNRAAIFLRDGLSSNGLNDELNRRLRVASAIGMPPGLLEHFELSLDSGLAGQVYRLGRILRRHSEEVALDVEAQKEFELLGAQVAVPMFDRDSLLGIVLLDGRITGEPLTNSELELVFHLLEQVGLGIRNIWLHDQLSANSETMADVLRELNSACVVVGSDLQILHANKMARKYFHQVARSHGEIEFNDLPQVLGAKIYQVLQSGAALTPFRYEPEGDPGTIYSVTIVPLRKSGTTLPTSVLMVVDDQTQSEQLRKLEVETANLRLIRAMADRLAHEVGNAMVPISTHQQLLGEKHRDAEFRASLDNALSEGVKRVNRLINQMRYLARDSVASTEAIPLAALIDDAYQEARKYQPSKTAQLKYDSAGKSTVIQGDRAALKYALTEVLINALQANPSDPKVGIRFETGVSNRPGGELQIEVQDNGQGFTPEAMQKAFAPFYGTRNVGLGLGLTVTRKIIETHRGKLEIVSPASGHAGVVRISLPVEKSTEV